MAFAFGGPIAAGVTAGVLVGGPLTMSRHERNKARRVGKLPYSIFVDAFKDRAGNPDMATAKRWSNELAAMGVYGSRHQASPMYRARTVRWVPSQQVIAARLSVDEQWAARIHAVLETLNRQRQELSIARSLQETQPTSSVERFRFRQGTSELIRREPGQPTSWETAGDVLARLVERCAGLSEAGSHAAALFTLHRKEITSLRSACKRAEGSSETGATDVPPLNDATRQRLADLFAKVDARIEECLEKVTAEDFDCPVSFQPMQDPVRLPCSHYLDRSSAMESLRRYGECPCCRAPTRKADVKKAAEVTRAREAAMRDNRLPVSEPDQTGE